jgi:NitT/TauT family transport system ATP-binding protein
MTPSPQGPAEVDPAPPALEFDNVTCAFRPRAAGDVPYVAVKGASFAVAEGEFVALVGPTGCGKSTLLNAAAGLRPPTDGQLKSFGLPIAGTNARAGYLFQPDSLFPWRNALDNVAAGLEFRGAALAEARDRARPWLERVGLGAHAAKYPHEMSGGMRKRVALAQTWVLEPTILLMDEPFSALDVQTRQLMENELLSIWAERRVSVLLVTHDLEEAIALADRVIVLAAGPASRPVFELAIDLPRPRDVAEIRLDRDFVALHATLWQALKREVMTAHGNGR